MTSPDDSETTADPGTLEDEFSLLQQNASEAGLEWKGRPALRRETVKTDEGVEVSVVIWGTGDPEVVLVHGTAQNAHTWDSTCLALGRPVVAMDLPGHGHSAWRSDHDYSPEANAAAIRAVVHRFAPSLKLLVGMSLGGLSSLAAVGDEPDLTDNLLLVDITPGVSGDKAKAIMDFISGPEYFESFEQILSRTIEHNPTRTRESLRRGVIHNAKPLGDGRWTWRWDPDRPMARNDGGEIRHARLWEVLAERPRHLTLVQGGASPIVDPDDLDKLGSLRPDAVVITVEGAGHSVQGDNPLRLAEIIDRAVEGQPS